MAESLISSQVSEHLERLVPTRVSEIQRMESYAQAEGFPIVGPVAGQLCYQVARMIGAQRIFELGSGYGYSTAWFARAVVENGGGIVHHVVWDESLSQKARQHLSVLGYDGTIKYHVAEAVQALQSTDGPFDLIFNDIDKDGYPASLPVIAEKLRPGGVLIIDNMLWGGRIFDEADQSDSTKGIQEITRLLTTSNEWISSLIPIRDGLIMAMRH